MHAIQKSFVLLIELHQHVLQVANVLKRHREGNEANDQAEVVQQSLSDGHGSEALLVD